jgi:para-aminobenzoate synthetase / 4-amino-4-deoxychorismate lyase
MGQDIPAGALQPCVVLRDVTSGQWLRFTSPLRVVTAKRAEDVLPALQSVEGAVATEGLHAAGFVAYEAAPAFDAALPTKSDDVFPFLWFGLYRTPETLERLPAAAADHPPWWGWYPSISKVEYQRSFGAIHRFIRNGDTYQVNYTYRMRGTAQTDPWDLFLQLVRAQEPTCGAFIDNGEWVICSASPELFFLLNGEHIESRPMKGTAPRGLWFTDDRRKARSLRVSVKQRAENAMIVDMVRNDLGRIARIGSVSVPALFAVEQYPTVWQMVSTVQAQTDASLARIFQALFPPASITGAPKRRTMEIIVDLESSPRRIYTGAIGFVAPGRRAQFSVVIRTVLIDKKRREAEYGVGGGIVWDSRGDREWQESQVKARILRHIRPQFDLLETMRWTPDEGYALLRQHLTRLAQSAAYFSYAVDPRRVRQDLERFAAGLPRMPHRVRLTVARAGVTHIEATLFVPEPAGFGDIAPAQLPVDSTDPFLYHKTTHRRVYEQALKSRPGFGDVILFNQAGDVTESTIANIAVEIDGVLATPPVRCGLLAGTYRASLLKRKVLHERAFSLPQLFASPNVYLLNSLRGMHKVRVVQPEKEQAGNPSRSSDPRSARASR